MTITIDTITLPDVLRYEELGDSSVRADVRMSLGGAPIVFEQAVGGKYMDLVGTSDQAWIARDTLIALRAIARVPYATYTLTYESDVYTVRFRHEDQPVIEAEALVDRPNHEGDDWYTNVRIKLMEI